jgi:hypothetical protein
MRMKTMELTKAEKATIAEAFEHLPLDGWPEGDFEWLRALEDKLQNCPEPTCPKCGKSITARMDLPGGTCWEHGMTADEAGTVSCFVTKGCLPETVAVTQGTTREEWRMDRRASKRGCAAGEKWMRDSDRWDTPDWWHGIPRHLAVKAGLTDE